MFDVTIKRDMDRSLPSRCRVNLELVSTHPPFLRANSAPLVCPGKLSTPRLPEQYITPSLAEQSEEMRVGLEHVRRHHQAQHGQVFAP